MKNLPDRPKFLGSVLGQHQIKRPAESELFVSTSSSLIQSLAANPLPHPFDSALQQQKRSTGYRR
jgi:hypothetical protein